MDHEKGSLSVSVMYFSYQVLLRKSPVGQIQINICKMSEMNKGPKYIVLIVVTMLLVMTGYQYIINVTIMGVRVLSQPRRPTTEEKLSSNISAHFNASQTACPAVPDGLQGKVVVADQVVRIPELVRRNPAVVSGGEWRPDSCQARHHVALVIPFRNRLGQLLVFLNHIHTFLQRQELHYRIYVVTQVSSLTY